MSKHTVLDPAVTGVVSPHLCALGIMTKVPWPGRVKTRLTPPLTPEEAARLNECFLRDLSGSITAAAAQSLSRGVGVYTPPGEESAYEGLLPEDFILIPQRGSDFGDRLIFAVEDLLKVGFETVCLINSDSPTVPASSFAAAANELARSGDRIVLGPSDDGGYYLVGLKGMHRRVFEQIQWSTERVLEQTLQKADEIGLEVHLLPKGFDVDDRTTLERLCRELLDPAAPLEIAPHTREFLAGIVAREGCERICPGL